MIPRKGHIKETARCLGPRETVFRGYILENNKCFEIFVWAILYSRSILGTPSRETVFVRRYRTRPFP
jgi:hypothetical protein